MAIQISPEQRRALYKRMLDQLRSFDDLMNAVEAGDLESAYRSGRRFLDALRLIQEEIGWGEHHAGSLELRCIPSQELSSILNRIREEAAAQHERERPEQEEFQATWNATGLVRDTCDELIALLLRSPQP
jgi:hypothetical protein